MSVGIGSRDVKSAALQPGDVVEVMEGDLKHLTGKVMTIEGDNVTVKPHHKELQVHTYIRTYISGNCVHLLTS